MTTESIEVRPGGTLTEPATFRDLISARYDLVITALTPVVHSQGVVGNDSLLMTERVLDPSDPDGVPEDVPCLTGNSLRHSLREGLARMTLRILDLDLHSLPLAAQHFLLSGGSLGKQAATLDVEGFGNLMAMFPYVGLFGGGLGSVLIPGKLQVGYGVLICQQNAWRIAHLCPALEGDHPRPAQDFRERHQGTRHDARRAISSRHLLPEADTDAYIGRLTDEDVEGKGGSTQMIYGYEAISAGARWLWQVGGQLMTPLEHSALICALVGMAARGEVGAKNGTGHGRVMLRAIGERGEDHPLEDALGAVQTDAVAQEVADRLAGGYVSHVQDRAEDIRAWLGSMK